MAARKPQRTRKDAISYQVKLRQSAPSAFPWPDEAFRFPDQARQSRAEAIATRVWRNRAPEDWLPADALQICLYATTSVQHQDAQAELADSTLLVQSEGSRMARPNPLVTMMQQLAATMLSCARALAITGTQTSRKDIVQGHAKELLAHHPVSPSAGTNTSAPLGKNGRPDYSKLLM